MAACTSEPGPSRQPGSRASAPGERHVRTRRPLGRTCCATNPTRPHACRSHGAGKRTNEPWNAGDRQSLRRARPAAPRRLRRVHARTRAMPPAPRCWPGNDGGATTKRTQTAGASVCSSGPRPCADTAAPARVPARLAGRLPAGQLKVCILSFRLPSACFSNTWVATPPKVAGAPLASLPWIDHLAAATTRSSWPSPTTSSSSSL